MGERTVAACETEIAMLREMLAEAYKELSGHKQHASNCATSRAPAETPRRCDCRENLAFLNWPSAKIDEPVGWLGSNLPTPDHFECEFCGATDLDVTMIPHAPDCLIMEFRAIIKSGAGFSQVDAPW